jgi:hypothetical protein
MSVKNAIMVLLTKRKEGDNMSANVYSVQSLLVGKEYISKTMRGEIINAEPHPKAVWYQGAEAYLVRIAPYSGYNNWGRKTYRTVAVKVGE